MSDRLHRFLRRESSLLLVVFGLAAMLGARLARLPLTGYGDNGAEYNEHSTRLNWLLHLRSRLQDGEYPGLVELLRQLESGFPPGLYITGNLLRPVAGFQAEVIGPVTGGLAAVVLVVSVGFVAWRISGAGGAVRAAVLGTLLLPAVHGSALRYYFDLPMTAAIWASVAVLAGLGPRRPILAGLAAGSLAVLASLLKWTAIPFLLPMLLGLSFCRLGGEDRPESSLSQAFARPGRKACMALLLALGLWTLGAGSYLAVLGTPNSLLAMARESSIAAVSDQEPASEPALGGIPGLAGSALQALAAPKHERQVVRRSVFYALGGIFSVFSPVLALACLLLCFLWLRRGGRGWPLLVSTVLGQGLFLLLMVRPADERFLLTLAPAIVLAAALGWAGLVPPWRKRVAVAVVVTGLLVALDFHHLSGNPLSWESSVALHDETAVMPAVPLGPVTLRGLGAASSVEQRGWSRLDEAAPRRQGLREGLVGWLIDCRPQAVALRSSEPLISPRGDHAWLEYRDALERVEGRVRSSTAVLDQDCEGGEELPAGTVFLMPVGPPGDPPAAGPWASLALPSCLARSGWQQIGSIPDPARGPGIGLWFPAVDYACPGD